MSLPAVVLRPVYDHLTGGAFPEAVYLLYQLLEERPEIANISHSKMPSFEEHVLYVRSMPYREWWIVTAPPQEPRKGLAETVHFEPVSIGAVYATEANEVGVAIFKRFWRRGYAEAALRLLLGQIEPAPAISGERRGAFVAHVAPGNEASHALFRKLRGKPVQITYELPRGG